MARRTPVGVFQAYSIQPKGVLSSNRVRGKILAQLNKEVKEAERLMNMPIATWDDPPTIVATSPKYAGGEIHYEVRVAGTDQQRNKWLWLDKGTKVRYATMTSDFKRKTAPRRLTSTAGTSPSRDGVAIVSKKYPRPGIQARQWSSIINRRLRDRLRKNIPRAIREGLEPK